MEHVHAAERTYLNNRLSVGARCSSGVECLLIRSIPHGGTTEIFLVSASYTQRLWYVLSCLWDGAYKKSFAANW